MQHTDILDQVKPPCGLIQFINDGHCAAEIAFPGKRSGDGLKPALNVALHPP
jgi:hypothetical protein